MNEITLSRDVEAIQIPSGDKIDLPIGTKVMITQALGGTYTVATNFGLARIKSENADALGIDLEAEKSKLSAASEAIASGDVEGAIWEQLKLVYDPEIPVNIVDLGLVYDCQVKKEEGATNVEIKMTLTAPGCGIGPDHRRRRSVQDPHARRHLRRPRRHRLGPGLESGNDH